LPVDFNSTVAILAEPLAVALRGIRRLQLEGVGECLVFGDGPLGLLLLLVLKHFGVSEVKVVGGVPDRLALALELGADSVFPYQQAGEYLVKGVQEALGKEFPLVIEASGSPLAAQASLQLAQRAGQVLIIGDYDDARAHTQVRPY
jgi:L-idonate 5-dehydrogenase